MGIGGGDQRKLSTEGFILELSRCKLRVVGDVSGLSPVEGYVHELRIIDARTGKKDVLADYEMVAANGFVQLNEGTNVIEYSRPYIEPFERKCDGSLFENDIPCDCPDLFGDVNRDCIVTSPFWKLIVQNKKKI